MHTISESVTRKFVESFDIDDFQIESDTGWVDVTHLNVTVPYQKYILKTTNCYLECADDHIVFDRDHNEIFVKDLSSGSFIMGQHGLEEVLSVTVTNEYENMFDLSVTGNHTYYAEGLLHHNTQTVAAYILHYVLFNESKTVAILANKATAAREIMSRFQLMYEYLPNWLQQGITTWNKGDIELENGSKVFTAATAASGIRGKSVNFLYVDEAAIIPNTVADDFFTSTYPTISAGKTTKIVLTSTPLGYNHWWKFWNESTEGRNGFVPVEITYDEHPDRDEVWAKKQRELLGELKYKQEVECSFLGSALTLISSDVLSHLSYVLPIYSKDGLDIYENPVMPRKDDNDKIVDVGGNYVIVVDTAKGVGGDASSFQVIDITSVPYKIVAKYRDTEISPMLYPTIIHKVARDYNNAYVMIEINASEQVAYILYSELEYDNMIFVTRTAKGQFASAGFAGAGKTALGLNMDKRIKRIGCFNFKTLVEEKKLLIHDADTIAEISTFIEQKGSYAADEGYHDDLVMPLVMFGWLTTNPYFKELTNVNLRTEIYQQRIAKIEEEMTPFGFVDDGLSEEVYVEDGDSWNVFNKPGYLSSNF